MNARLLLVPVLFLLTAPAAAQTKTEIGEIDHAQFRIDIPENWNHGLVVYCHGYSADPLTYDSKKELPKGLAVFVKAGYALAQSGYSAGGWAIEQAIPDTEALHRYFIFKYGQPTESYVAGHSMGGFLTMAMIEKFPDAYDAGLALCGPLASASWIMQRFNFDLRVVFDYYFPRALPSAVKVPAEYKMDDGLRKKILRLLNSKPAQAGILRRLSGTHNNKDLADGVVFGTYVLKDLQQRAGGNPFDNRDTIYTGTPDDNALNDKVKRYAADPGALDYLQRYYTPSGRITRPILAIHTTYDPIVSPAIPNMYALLTREAGKQDLFVQEYVKHNGHCNISPEETAYGFTALRHWKENGERPMAGVLSLPRAGSPGAVKPKKNAKERK